MLRDGGNKPNARHPCNNTRVHAYNNALQFIVIHVYNSVPCARILYYIVIIIYRTVIYKLL